MTPAATGHVVREKAEYAAAPPARAETTIRKRNAGSRTTMSTYDAPWTIPPGVIKSRGISRYAPQANNPKIPATRSKRCCRARFPIWMLLGSSAISPAITYAPTEPVSARTMSESAANRKKS